MSSVGNLRLSGPANFVTDEAAVCGVYAGATVSAGTRARIALTTWTTVRLTSVRMMQPVRTALTATAACVPEATPAASARLRLYPALLSTTSGVSARITTVRMADCAFSRQARRNTSANVRQVAK